MKDYSLKMKSELYLFEVKAKHIVITVRKIIIRYFACLLDIVTICELQCTWSGSCLLQSIFRWCFLYC